MKQILSFLLFLLPALAFAQWPAAPNKIRLGNQTTGDGLIVRTDSIPDWTPADRNNAWLAFDTVANLLYFYEGGTWQEYSSGGGVEASIYTDSGTVAPIPDMLVRVRPDTTFSIGECIGCTGFEDFWNNTTFGQNKKFAGHYASTGYFRGVGSQVAAVEDSVRAFVGNELYSGNNQSSYLYSIISTIGGTLNAFAEISTKTPRDRNNASTGVFIAGSNLAAGRSFYSYKLPDTNPEITSGAISLLAQNGNGSAATPSWHRFVPGNNITLTSEGDSTIITATGGSGVQYSDSLTVFVTPSQLSDSLAANVNTYANGLTLASDTVKLGGALTGNTTISGDFTLTRSGSVATNVFNASNSNGGFTSSAITGTSTGSGRGVYGQGASGYGVYGVSSSSYGVLGTSTTGYAVGGTGSRAGFFQGTSNTSPSVLISNAGSAPDTTFSSAAQFQAGVGSADSTSVFPVLSAARTQVGGARPQNGMGISFPWFINTLQDTVSNAIASREVFNQRVKLTDRLTGSASSEYEILLRNNDVLSRVARIAPTGQLTLDGYTTNTFIGTGWARLAVDASGVVVADTTTTGGGGVTSITAGVGLTGGTITASGTIAADTAVLATLYDIEIARDTVLKTSTVTAAKSQITLVDCSGGAITIDPPSAPVAGDWFAVSDARAASATNNITIDFDSAAQNLYGSQQNYILNTNGAYVKFMYVADGTGWIATKG